MQTKCGRRLAAIFPLVDELRPTGGTRPINNTPACQTRRCLFGRTLMRHHCVSVAIAAESTPLHVKPLVSDRSTIICQGLQGLPYGPQLIRWTATCMHQGDFPEGKLNRPANEACFSASIFWRQPTIISFMAGNSWAAKSAIPFSNLVRVVPSSLSNIRVLFRFR